MYEFTSAICFVAVAGWLVALYRQRNAPSVGAAALHRPGSRLAARLPDHAVLDRLACRTAVLALPIWTFAIITGAIWAEAAWGRYWGWDLKETCALVAWVYAVSSTSLSPVGPRMPGSDGPGEVSALVFRLLPLAIQTFEELRVVVRGGHGACRRLLWVQRLP